MTFCVFPLRTRDCLFATALPTRGWRRIAALKARQAQQMAMPTTLDLLVLVRSAMEGNVAAALCGVVKRSVSSSVEHSNVGSQSELLICDMLGMEVLKNSRTQPIDAVVDRWALHEVDVAVRPMLQVERRRRVHQRGIGC